MNRQSRLFILLLAFFITVSAVNGQSGLGLNAGYINPFPILNYETSYTSASADYAGSFFVSITFRKKAGNKLFLAQAFIFTIINLITMKKMLSTPGWMNLQRI